MDEGKEAENIETHWHFFPSFIVSKQVSKVSFDKLLRF